MAKKETPSPQKEEHYGIAKGKYMYEKQKSKWMGTEQVMKN